MSNISRASKRSQKQIGLTVAALENMTVEQKIELLENKRKNGHKHGFTQQPAITTGQLLAPHVSPQSSYVHDNSPNRLKDVNARYDILDDSRLFVRNSKDNVGKAYSFKVLSPRPLPSLTVLIAGSVVVICYVTGGILYGLFRHECV